MAMYNGRQVLGVVRTVVMDGIYDLSASISVGEANIVQLTSAQAQAVYEAYEQGYKFIKITSNNGIDDMKIVLTISAEYTLGTTINICYSCVYYATQEIDSTATMTIFVTKDGDTYTGSGQGYDLY